MEGFQGYRSTLLGKGMVRRLNRWFVVNPGAVCFSAVSGEEVWGYVVGAPSGFTRALTRYSLVHAGAALLCRPRLWFHPPILKGIMVKLLQILGVRFGPPPPPGEKEQRGDFALVGIGVDDRHRGLGIAGILMAAFEKEVTRRGYPRMTLSVKRGNAAARRAYEKSGWRIVHEDPFNDLLVFEKGL